MPKDTKKSKTDTKKAFCMPDNLQGTSDDI